MRSVVFFISLTILFISCCNEKETDLYKGNITELLPWIDKEKIKEVQLPNHKYVAYVDSSNEFSYGFKAYYKDINPAKPKKVSISCEIYPYNLPNNVQLVLEMKENETNIFWKSEKIVNGRVGEWNKVTLKADIPQNLPPDVTISTYIWSPNKEAALVDNFIIKFE